MVEAENYPKYLGPFYITQRTSDCNYVIRNCKDNRLVAHPVHFDRLKPFYENREEFEKNDGLLKDDSDSNDIEPESVANPIQDQSNHNQPLSIDEPNQVASQWETVEKLVGVKTVQGQKYFKVIWENKMSKPEWLPQHDISDALIRSFYLTHTQKGTRRRKGLFSIRNTRINRSKQNITNDDI